MRYDEILQAVIEMAQAVSELPVVVGSMPPDDGVAMTGQAYSDPIFLDIGSNERMTVVCNGKSRGQQTIINTLDAIHSSLTRRKDFPQGADWQIFAIETIASPRLIGREANSEWLYGSSLAVKINVKGKCT